MLKKVLIADDHPIFRAGLRQIVEELDGFEVAAEAGDGNSCITCLEIIQPDIVVLDLAMPGTDGYGVLEWLKTNMPQVVAVIISMHSSSGFAAKARVLGARAFVAKEDASAELHNALVTPKSIFYLSASVGDKPLMASQPVIESDDDAKIISKLELLTPAERNVFDLVGLALTSRQIGEQLSLSFRTIQTHRQHINQKLNISGPNALLQYATRIRAKEKT